MGNVVAVAHVDEPQPLEPAEAFPQREQVGQRLAGVVVGREHVDDRDRGVLGELLDQPVRPGAHADRVNEAREHQRGVAHRLPARELHLVLAQYERVTA